MIMGIKTHLNHQSRARFRAGVTVLFAFCGFSMSLSRQSAPFCVTYSQLLAVMFWSTPMTEVGRSASIGRI